MNFENVIDSVIKAEAGYVDNPHDSGGPTNFGITVAVARANGYVGDMQELPESLARAIYRKRYIAEPKFDLVALIDAEVAAELIDTGVNMGPPVASVMFQRWLNAFNSGGSHYADVFVDGRIGDVTLESFKAYRRWRGADGTVVMLYALNGLQAERYLELAEKDKKNRDFTYGWIKERVAAQLMART